MTRTISDPEAQLFSMMSGLPHLNHDTNVVSFNDTEVDKQFAWAAFAQEYMSVYLNKETLPLEFKYVLQRFFPKNEQGIPTINETWKNNPALVFEHFWLNK